jgi:hypothetical protein
VINDHSLHIFVDEKAGTGKTHIVNVICDKIRSLGCVVLPTAIAAFAAQHYAGGRTTHSAFKVRACLPIINWLFWGFCADSRQWQQQDVTVPHSSEWSTGGAYQNGWPYNMWCPNMPWEPEQLSVCLCCHHCHQQH